MEEKKEEKIEELKKTPKRVSEKAELERIASRQRNHERNVAEYLAGGK